MVELTAMEQNKEKRMKRNEDSLRHFWDNIKCNNIHIIGVPEGEEREKGPEKIFEETIVENFPNIRKEIATQVQEAQRAPYRINPRRNTPRHIVIKLAKIKGRQCKKCAPGLGEKGRNPVHRLHPQQARGKYTVLVSDCL